MRIVVVLILPNSQIFSNLSNIGRIGYEAVLFNIIVGVDFAHIGFQVLSIYGDVDAVVDLFPT